MQFCICWNFHTTRDNQLEPILLQFVHIVPNLYSTSMFLIQLHRVISIFSPIAHILILCFAENCEYSTLTSNYSSNRDKERLDPSIKNMLSECARYFKYISCITRYYNHLCRYICEIHTKTQNELRDSDRNKYTLYVGTIWNKTTTIRCLRLSWKRSGTRTQWILSGKNKERHGHYYQVKTKDAMEIFR